MTYEELTTGPWLRNFWRAKELQAWNQHKSISSVKWRERERGWWWWWWWTTTKVSQFLGWESNRITTEYKSNMLHLCHLAQFKVHTKVNDLEFTHGKIFLPITALQNEAHGNSYRLQENVVKISPSSYRDVRAKQTYLFILSGSYKTYQPHTKCSVL
jgi:hypothetical protein